MEGPLSKIKLSVTSKVASLVTTCNVGSLYDDHCCILSLIEAYSAGPEAVDDTLPQAVPDFKVFVNKFFQPQDLKETGIVNIATVHGSQGKEADDVYIMQPDLIPLEERVASGGWQAHEELCVAFVAVMRTKDRLVKLPHLEHFTRDTVLAFFDTPIEDEEYVAYQQTDSTFSRPSTPPSPSMDEFSYGESVKQALSVLHLTEMPETASDLHKSVKAMLFQAHPDRNFGDVDANRRTQEMLTARRILLDAYRDDGTR
jgi:hypothetical protein